MLSAVNNINILVTTKDLKSLFYKMISRMNKCASCFLMIKIKVSDSQYTILGDTKGNELKNYVVLGMMAALKNEQEFQYFE